MLIDPTAYLSRWSTFVIMELRDTEGTTFSLGFPVRSEVLAVVIVLRRRLRWFVLPGAACSAGLRGLRAP